MNQEFNVQFLGYYVREINFLKNENFKAEKITSDMKFTKNSTFLDQNKIRMNMKVILFEDAISKNYPFQMNLITSGLFQYQGIDIENEAHREALEQKCIEILYPYIRTIVSNITMTTNLPPLILPTINISELIK